jgi:prepilin-type N-terminal cleavage/methylation domain-containing protein
VISPQRRRDGFTLIELLVVISVIALLIGLILPAVQQARESANRTSCGNNLHQITLAMQQYHDVYQHLPPRCVGDSGPSWMVLILPYMEQDSLYNHWDLSRTYYDQPDAARKASVSNYFCPSRRTAGTAGYSVSGDQQWQCGDSFGPHVPGGLSDYAACLGDIAFT